MKFRNDIQGIRALAVLLVFIFHLEKFWLPGGFIGVDVFFVISGFLITTIIKSKISKGSFSLKDFYLSRISRIVPAYYFMTLVVSIASLFVYFNFDIEKILRKELIYVLGFASNNYFSKLGTYFGASLLENPFLHSWTLGVEMQFYFILPFLLLAFKKSNIASLIILFITIVLFCFGSYKIFVENDITSTYFSLIARIPEFLIGSLVSFINKDYFTNRKRLTNAFSILGLGLIFFSAYFFSEHTPFPGFTALVPCVGAAILILTSESFINKQLAAPVPKYIGEISYSIYLWHWPVMALARYFYGVETFGNVFQYMLVIVLTIVMSLTSYYLIEYKLRHVKTIALFKFLIPISFLCLAIPFTAKYISDRIYDLPKEFVQPTFGTNSHNVARVETLGSVGSFDSSIFLTGNSHALVIKGYLNYMGLAKNFSFKTLTCDTYPPLSLNKDSLISDGYFNNEYYVLSQSLQPIVTNQIKNCKTIFFAINDNAMSIKTIQNALLRIVDSSTSDQNIVFFKTFPVIDGNPIKINRGISRKTDYKFNVIRKPAVDSFMRILLGRKNNVHIFDLTNSDVYKEIPYKNDSVLYYNGEHLNLFGTLKLAESQLSTFSNFFDKLKSDGSSNSPSVK